MKKIIAITAMVAAAAGIAFAAEVSSATKIKGTVFSYSDGNIGLFQQANDSHDYANPNLVFSIDGEKAGATIKLTTDGGTKTVAQTTQTIWFKPIEALKINVGSYDIALNKEQIKWTESVTGLGGAGYVFSVNAAGFGLDLMLNSGDALWFVKNGSADPVMKEMSVKASYSADFGNVGAYVTFNRTTNRWTYHDKFFVGLDKKSGAVSDVSFGAGYGNNIAGVNLFVNVAGYLGNSFDWIRPEIFASGSAGALSYAAFVAPLIVTNSDLVGGAGDPFASAFECQLVAKLSYDLGGVTPYVQFYDANLLASTFASSIEVGASGSIDALGWKAWLQIDTGAVTTISVPFELTISF
jgi:hypothetical protein